MKSNNIPNKQEVLRAGKTLVRTNFKYFYLPIDESQGVERTNEFGETYIEYPSPELDYCEFDEHIAYSNCIALLTFSQYYKLNKQLSEVKGYTLNKDTARVWPITPILAVVGDAIRCVAEVSKEVQEKYPELFEEYEYCYTYVPYDGEMIDIICEGLTSIEVDWVLQHYERIGQNIEGLMLWLESEAPSPEMESVIEKLVNKGLIIGVVSNEED